MEFESIVSFELSGENTNYNFPTFYYSTNGRKFYFKSITLELGSTNFVIGDRKVGKSLFLKSLTGIECPQEKPLDRKFLKYDIVYKPELIVPKFNGTLNELIQVKGLKNNNYFMDNLSLLDMKKYLDTKVKNFSEEQKQILSFLLLLSTEGLIYIMDCPTHLISLDKRRQMINIFKNYCSSNDKIGIITEDDINLVDSIIDETTDIKYFIKKFGENEFYGGF